MINNNELCRGNRFLKYLSEELKKEYLRVSQMCSPIEELHHPLITVEDVLRAYFILADYFTDDSGGNKKESMLVGLRSEEEVRNYWRRRYQGSACLLVGKINIQIRLTFVQLCFLAWSKIMRFLMGTREFLC